MSALTGSYAVVAHLHGSDLYVANTGDSRAVVGSRNKDGTWAEKALRGDHQPSNPKETERLKRKHPGEEKTIAFRPRGSGPLRVIGGMMPSRLAAGRSEEDCRIDSEPTYREVHVANSTVLLYSALHDGNPEIRHHTLTSEDYFLVMATDGIFDELSNDEVVRAVGNFLDNQSLTNKNYVNAATHLIRVALSQGEGQEGVSRMLSFRGIRVYGEYMTVQRHWWGSVASPHHGFGQLAQKEPPVVEMPSVRPKAVKVGRGGSPEVVGPVSPGGWRTVVWGSPVTLGRSAEELASKYCVEGAFFVRFLDLVGFKETDEREVGK
ncbi:[Pyruvate dehydrogenase [acetyl-transferring]]-phosphatase 1, mitochondrial [Rhizophlyctis rosea]|nr:[Pyruvate dehydrogenase [acetyl-transferring]]-phosphatase 1, mitochondrial [Rhizophlyctis rosea]